MKKKGNNLKVILALLIIALIAVAAVIVVKQMEYGQSEQYYNNLRGAVRLWRMEV